MIIKSTRDYKQFKTVLGNRAVDMNHVNYLIKLNSENNLLWQFPATVTKDGYIWDGQHRLKVAETQEWDFFYTVSDKTLKEMGDTIVAIANTAQKPWNPKNFINYYAKHGNEQYIFLQYLMTTYGLSHASILALTGFTGEKDLRMGKLSLFNSEDEKAAVETLVDGFTSLKDKVPGAIFRDREFAMAVRVLFKQVSAEDIKHEIDTSKIQIVPQVGRREYLRMFEEVFNYRRREENHVRFF